MGDWPWLPWDRGNMMTHQKNVWGFPMIYTIFIPYLYHIYSIFVQRISLNIHCVTWHFFLLNCWYFPWLSPWSTYWIFLVDHSIKIIHFCGLKSPLVSDFWVNQAPDHTLGVRSAQVAKSSRRVEKLRQPRSVEGNRGGQKLQEKYTSRLPEHIYYIYICF